MKVYRGPQSKPFWDDSHEFVSQVKPEELEKGISEKAYITFNISKDYVERQSICTTQFEDEDIVPMIRGLLSRLSLQQSAIVSIKKILKDTVMDSAAKLTNIESQIEKLK